MAVYLQSEDDISIFEKNKTKRFEKIGWYQMLSFWNKQTREMYKQNKIINNLITNRDYSTLFELYKNDYKFTEKQLQKIHQSIDKTLIDRNYANKIGIFELMNKYEIEIPDIHYYHYIISNSFHDTIEHLEKYSEYKIEEPIIDYIKNTLLKNEKFKKGLHEFIIKDIENQPNNLGSGMNWSMSRDCYYQPLKYSNIFKGMTKNQLSRIIKQKLGTKQVIKEYQVLLNQAPIDNNIMEQLGIDTKSLVAKAQKEILLSEDGLSNEMKEKIKLISAEIEKIQNSDTTIYLEQVSKLSEITLPTIIKKYLSIDEEYRHSLKNVEGKLPSELLMESLDNIFMQVKNINQCINEEKITGLSVENRKLKK